MGAEQNDSFPESKTRSESSFEFTDDSSHDGHLFQRASLLIDTKTFQVPSDTSIKDSNLVEQSCKASIEDFDTPSQVAGAPLVSVNAASKLGRFQFLSDCRTSIPLLLVDACAVLLAVLAANASAIFLFRDVSEQVIFQSRFFTIAIVFFTLVIHHIHGLYPAVGLSHSIEFRRILRTCLIVSLATVMALLSSPTITLSALLCVLVFIGVLVALLPTFRAIGRSVFSRYLWWTQSVLVVGDGSEAEVVFQNLSRSRHEGLRPIGIAYNALNHWNGDTTGAKVYLGPITAIEQILLTTRTSRVVIVDINATKDFHFGHYCGIPHVVLHVPWSKHPTEKATLVERNGSAEIHCFQRGLSPSALFAKRCMDVSSILICSPILIPLFAAIACFIKLSSPGPVFYGQLRLGKNGKSFRVWKFRSMVPNADTVLKKHLAEHPELQAEWDRDHKLKNDPRITTIGRFLRKSSFDELPQLWNVFVGEMSLVGPRPIVNDEIVKYGEVYPLYSLVRPGITGLWQISGRNNTTYQERLGFDRSYVQNWSVMLDLYIIYRTVKTTVMQEGAY